MTSRTPTPCPRASIFALVALVWVAACGGLRVPPFPVPDSGADRPDPTPLPSDDATNDTNLLPDLGRDVIPTPDRAIEAALPDAAAGPEVGDARDVTADDGSPALDAPACTELSGTSPFGKALSGTATFAPSYGPGAPITLTETVYIYFPAGRVAGAPVQLALQSGVVPLQYFFGPQVTLAADLSATGLTVGGHDTMVTGDLLPGTGGLQATVSENFSSPSTDVADPRSAAMRMCPSGDVPAAMLQIGAATLGPISTLAIHGSTPLTVPAIEALRIASPLGPVAFRVSRESNSRYAAGPNFTVAPASAFPPGQPLTFDPSAVRDVLGRPVSVLAAGAQVLATTAVLGDLTLATVPPAGAIAGSGCKTSAFEGIDGGAASGMLKCTGGGSLTQGVLSFAASPIVRGGTVDALLALPSTSASQLRIRMVVGDVVEAGTACRNGYASSSMRTGVVAVVGPNGEASPAQNLTCDGAMADYLIELPKASPLWLVVRLEGYAALPYMLLPMSPPAFSIDDLELR